ncbi:MAG: transcriptional repressor, partial [Aquirufa sp.]
MSTSAKKRSWVRTRLCEKQSKRGICRMERHDFGDGRARYEAAPEAHHDHLIDVETGKVI